MCVHVRSSLARRLAAQMPSLSMRGLERKGLRKSLGSSKDSLNFRPRDFPALCFRVVCITQI